MYPTPMYAVTIRLDNVLERTIENLTLYEAYQVVKPAPMDLQENRWHVMLYPAVAERLGALPLGEPLLVAWEQQEENLASVSKYITRID
jgi:hypothetical protein